MRDKMSSEGRGIDVMVYYRTKGLEEDRWKRDGDRIDAACRTPAQDAEGRRRGGVGWWEQAEESREKGRQVERHHSKPYWTAILQAS